MSLQLAGVHIGVGGRVLVSGLDAAVGPGECLAVTGPSGSGKSSLLAWVAGVLEPPFQAGGRVHLGDRDVTGLPVEQRRIALMFQDDLLFPHLSVLDNLLFAVPPGPAAERGAAARRALAQAELDGFEARRPHELSGGQRSRVSLLRALLARPLAVLLDEPFSRLDAALRERTREWVWARLAEHRLPALLVTHDVADAPPGARRIAIGTA